MPPVVISARRLKSPVATPSESSEQPESSQEQAEETPPPPPRRKRNRQIVDEDTSSQDETSSSSDEETSDQPNKIHLHPPFDDEDVAMALTNTSPLDQMDVEPEKEKTTKKPKAKRRKKATSNEESSASLMVTPQRPSPKGKGKAKAIPEEETKTPTQKETRKRSLTAISIPSWLINSEEVTESAKASWEWAPEGAPPSGYDVPDIFGKEVKKKHQAQVTANFLHKYISDLHDPISQNKGVWAAHLYSVHKKKPLVIEKAIREMFGEGHKVAHVSGSVWSLVYSPTGEHIAKDMLEKAAIIQRSERRAIVFRSLALPSPRNFKIREVRSPRS